MQFTYAALAVLATTVLADKTVYRTEEITITSCAPTVTDCPAHSTVTSMTSYPVPTTTAEEGPETITDYTTIVNTITSCAPTVTNCPVGHVSTTIIPVPTNTGAPIPSGGNEGPAPPVTVTVTINSCPATTPSVPTLTSVVVPPVPTTPVPTISGFPTPSNGTSVTPPKPTSPPIPGAAAAMTGSLATLGFAAMVAVLFA